MTLIRKLSVGLLISLLVGATAFAQAPLSPQARARLAGLLASGATSAQIIQALQAEGVNVTSAAAIEVAFDSILTEVAASAPDLVSTASSLLTQAVTENAAATGSAATVTAITSAAARGTASGAVKGAAAALGATPDRVNAAAQAAASGSSSGAVLGTASSGNTTLVTAAASAASAGSSAGARSGAATVTNLVLNVNTVGQNAASGSNQGATAAASATGQNVQTVVNASNTGSGGTQTVTVTTTETGETETADPEPNHVVNTKFANFTLRLSGNRFVSINLNDQNNNVVVAVTNAVVGTGTAQLGNGGLLDFTVPANVLTSLNKTTLTLAQREAIRVGILAAVPGLVVVQVPSTTITISPSS